MKRILFILLILNTCFLSLYAQKHKKKTVKNEHTEQQINQNKATKKEAIKLVSSKKQAEKHLSDRSEVAAKHGKKQPVDKQHTALIPTKQQQTTKSGALHKKGVVLAQKRQPKGKKQQIKYVTTEEIKGLQQQNKQIQKEITENEHELKAKQKDVDNRLQKILTLDTEIGHQQKTINNISTDIKHLDGNIGILKGQLRSLETQLSERRSRFIRSMRYMARNRSIQDKIMFIFSAKTLTQMYRRLRFVREYAAYQRAQGELLKQKQAQVDNKHNQLEQVRGHKSNLLVKGRNVHIQMENKKVEQQKVVASLQNDQKVLQSVISDRQKKQQAINAQIDRLIAIEIRKARERAMEEARAQAAARAAAAKQRAEELARKREAARRAAEENARRIAEAKACEAKAKAEAAAKAAQLERERRAAQERAEQARREAEQARRAAEAEASAKRARELKRAEERAAAAKRAEDQARAKENMERERANQQAREAEANRVAAERKAVADRERADREQAAANRANENNSLLSSADRAITGSFANNKGRLPMPVSGPIVKRFGTYNVAGLSHVTLSSNGIAIKASPGAPVRSVFKGEVTSISHVGGSTLVMVRHGAYISVYLNLGSVSVSRGQQVGTGQTIGTVDSGGIFQFQLHKETQKLNPEQWLR